MQMVDFKQKQRMVQFLLILLIQNKSLIYQFESQMKHIILCISLFLTICLTSQASLSARHQLTPRYNDTAYADELSKRQSQFENTMKDIQQQVADLDQSISKYEGNDTYQIMKLQEGLADERDALYDVQNNLNQPFALKPCQKPNLTDEEKTQLNKQIKITNQSLFDMKAEVKKCTAQSTDQCTVTDELIHQITRAELYLQVMDDYVNGDCKRVPRIITIEEATGLVDLNDRLFKDNLKAPNWVYGNITEEQYRLIVFSQTTKFNMTTCPLQTPFANKVNNTCFPCPQGSIFSLGQRVCTCQTGYKFDQQTNECVSLTPIKPCNETGSCISMCPKERPRWNAVNKLCESCPVDKPVVNRATSSCESCPEANPVWNQLTYQCEPCPKNTHFVPNVSKCVPCKDEQRYDESIKKCVPICKSYQVYNKQEGKCYTFEELNGCKCNQRYNTTLKECEDICENGLRWLPSENKCGPPSLPDFKDNCKYYQRINPETKQCENYCDSTVAWYDRQNHVCIKIGCSVECKCGEIFDNLTAKCIPESHQCPATQFYNTTSEQCQIWCSNNLVYNPQTKTCVQPTITITPNCSLDELYDQPTNRCVKRCPSPLQTFNSATLSCECIVGYHLDTATGACIVNPIQCGQNQRYSQSMNSCVCNDGFIVDNQNNCVPMCDPKANKLYDTANKRCVCAPGYLLGNDQQTCISSSSLCLSENHQHYDESSKACVCDAGYQMNVNEGKCYVERKMCNQSVHFVLNPQTNQCECGSGFKASPDGRSCFSVAEMCLRNPNTNFNYATSTCECLPGYSLSSQTGDVLVCQALCKVDETYNQMSQQCVKLCPNDYYYNTTTHSCLYKCAADYVYNNATQQCERTIKTCPDPVNQFYDNKTGQCHSCPQGYTLNHDTMLCEKKTITCPPGQFYDESAGLCKYCKQGQIYNNLTKVCQFSNTTCTNGMYFDFTLGQCKYCPAGYIYDEALLQCRANCTQDQMFDYTRKQCISISSTCSSYQYYDPVQRKCIFKPICSSIQRYDEVSKRCVDINFITSKSAKNLIHSNFRSYVTYYDSRKAADPYLTDCPQNTPFYSLSSKACVFCPTTNPYYDLESEKCLDCGNDKYDANLRKCVSSAPTPSSDTDNPENLNYSLDRLMMNIV